MKVYRDHDGTHRIEGFEEFAFSSEEDALSATEFGIAFASEQAIAEWRNRQAAKRGQQKVAELGQ